MKLEKLTKEQEEMIPVIRDKWLNLIFNNRIDKVKATKGIDWLYSYCGKEKPIIIFMDSPFGCQVAANYFINIMGKTTKGLANISNNISDNIWDNIKANIGANIGADISDNIWTNIWADIRDNINNNIGNNIGANIRDNIGTNIRANINNNIWANINNNIGNNIVANIGDNIMANIWTNIKDNKLTYHATAWRGTPNDYGLVACLDYFLQLKLIHYDKEVEFNKWKELLLAGAFEMIQMEGICFVSDMPTYIKRDDNNRLHNLDDMAVQFKDQWGQYYIHGRNLPEALFKSIKDKSITSGQFFNEKNEEVKSACIAMMQELYGEEYVFRFFEKDLKETSSYIDKKEEKYLEGTMGMNIGVYTLFKGTINDEPVAYVRCYCPSTDRMFFLGVDPSNTNAKDAIASLCVLPRKVINHVTSINRQGERFCTTYSKEGWNILNKLSKEELNDLIPVSGDQYFKLMQYEY